MLQNIGQFKYGDTGYQRNNVKSPIFRRAIRIVVILGKLRRRRVASLQASNPSTISCSRLRFLQDIPPVVYTGENIVANLEIELVDAVIENRNKYGSEAYAKVEIVVLNEDFDPKQGSWTAVHESNIQIGGGRARNSVPGKYLYLNLQGGIGCASEVKLKHTAQWTKISKVRLGARVVDLPYRIKEAVTGLFVVKDKRLKSPKRDPPSPTDEVWRLEKIYRYGQFHKKLTAMDIRTVGDFLTEFSKNAARLRGVRTDFFLGNLLSQRLELILGPTMSDHMWNATITHAQRCRHDTRQLVRSPIQRVSMVRCGSSSPDMTSNQHDQSEDFLQKLKERLSNAIIWEESEQVQYEYQQDNLLQTRLKENEVSEYINELLEGSGIYLSFQTSLSQPATTTVVAKTKARRAGQYYLSF
ncbi:calmodulin-binding protein 60 B-like isoform X1 [Nicotiana tomentosiformis]|uniref:calmodulin-binding protein 60 B-like isoform X1 n=1 Tax=Nicotiana tomentosiformis TaxID=4098 RepID=UPI00051BF0CC|nr:calmodulin-binding protein 60 B-like isoform X1 [Nicotiana tomentosiformis]